MGSPLHSTQVSAVSKPPISNKKHFSMMKFVMNMPLYESIYLLRSNNAVDAEWRTLPSALPTLGFDSKIERHVALKKDFLIITVAYLAT